MPTTRRRRSRRPMTISGLTEVCYHYLAFGDYFEGEGFADDKSEVQLLALWRQHREAILTRYSEENRKRGKWFAGRRPWFFWEHDCHAPRLTVTDLSPADREMKRWGHSNPYVFRFDGTEADLPYLKRLGLLEPWEIEAEAQIRGPGQWEHE